MNSLGKKEFFKLKRVKDYNDFIVDSLLESLGSEGVLPLVFSEKFMNILIEIDHPIAGSLQNMEHDSNQPITLIDVTDKNDLVSLSTSPKIIEFLSEILDKEKDKVMGMDFFKYYNNREDTWNKYRANIKIGKLVKRLLGDEFPDNGKPGKDIESFVNAYKTEFDKSDMSTLFELVKGDDIVKWYRKNNYASGGNGSTLYNSCMNDEDEFTRFYAINSDKVSMLILFEDDKKRKIVGRALVWKLDDPEDRTFMDRIYTIHDYQVEFFIEYAKKQKWLYKHIQTYGHERIDDPKDNSSEHRMLDVYNIKLNEYYPYLDTLQFLEQDRRILSSDHISDVRLTDVGGGAFDCEWSERYERWINMYNLGSKYVLCEIGSGRHSNDIDKVRLKDEAVYLPYYGSYISKERYDDMIVTTTIGGTNKILKDEAVYLKYYNGWADQRFADRELTYSDYEDDYLYQKDLVWSDIKESYITKDKSTKIYKDDTKSDTDWIPSEELDKLTHFDGEGSRILNK